MREVIKANIGTRVGTKQLIDYLFTRQYFIDAKIDVALCDHFADACVDVATNLSIPYIVTAAMDVTKGMYLRLLTTSQSTNLDQILLLPILITTLQQSTFLPLNISLLSAASRANSLILSRKLKLLCLLLKK